MPQLRPYQVESIEGLRAGVRQGHTRQILCAATGAGKSIIAVELIKLCKNKGSRALFVVDRRVLVDQFSRHLDSFGVDHGVLMSKHWRFRPEEKIQVASIQTLEKMDSWPSFEVIIIDEAHAMLRKSLKTMLTHRKNAIVTGLTATPFTKGIGGIYSNVVNVITMRELVDTGFLVPFRVFIAHEINTEGVKIVAGEYQKDEIEKRGLQIVGDVAADYISIATRTWGETRKTIVFCAGVAHGQELVRKFAEVGKNFISISYLDDDEYKAEVIQDFAKPDTAIDGLVSCDILTRGFDVPDVEHVIVARPLKKSLSMHIQMIGRGARPYPEKEFCVIQDHSGNYLRFRDDFDQIYSDGVHELNDDKEKPKKEPSERIKELSKCPRCKALWPAQSDTCVACGYVRERRNKVESVAGEMSELSAVPKKEKYSGEQKEHWYRQLLYIAHNKGYKIGWAYHQYLKKFGVRPAWKQQTALPTQDVLNWLKSQQIARRNAA